MQSIIDIISLIAPTPTQVFRMLWSLNYTDVKEVQKKTKVSWFTEKNHNIQKPHLEQKEIFSEMTYEEPKSSGFNMKVID